MYIYSLYYIGEETKGEMKRRAGRERSMPKGGENKDLADPLTISEL